MQSLLRLSTLKMPDIHHDQVEPPSLLSMVSKPSLGTCMLQRMMGSSRLKIVIQLRLSPDQNSRSTAASELSHGE